MTIKEQYEKYRNEEKNIVKLTEMFDEEFGKDYTAWPKEFQEKYNQIMTLRNLLIEKLENDLIKAIGEKAISIGDSKIIFVYDNNIIEKHLD